MAKQSFEIKNDKIRAAFADLKKKHPDKLKARLNLSWSNWGFGIEPLEHSARRLQGAGIEYIELHGNHYGPDLGYQVAPTLRLLGDHNITCAGVCGMYSPESELGSNSGVVRQRAVDYLKRTVPFAAAMGGSYVLVIPGAVGRPNKYDDSEIDRAVATLRLVADLFTQHKIKGAVEPIRAAEVSCCHTIADAIAFIEAVDHPGIQHINGDVYHMQVEESHIAEAVLSAGQRLTNIHLADSNRCALGKGSLDVDTLIMALYLVGFNRPGCYVTPEPLGPGGDPYPAMHGKPDPRLLDRLVNTTAKTWRQREDAVRAM